MNSTPKKRSLTRRQQQIFEFVRDKIINRGYGPTVREIGTEFGIKSPNGVMCHLKAIEKKGLIIRESNMSRAIKLADNPAQQQTMPFLGTAISGEAFQPAISTEERVDFTDLLKGTDRATLQVTGTAFSALGIHDGDYVVVSRESPGAPGNLVVAQDDRHHATLCRIPEDGGAPIPAIAGTIDAPRRKVLGVVAGVIRAFEIPMPPNSDGNGTSVTETDDGDNADSNGKA